MSRRLSLVALLLLLAAPAWATTYYVATTGDDGRSCTTAQSSSTPKRTIASGLTCLGAGDTLYLRGGTYVESMNSNNQPIPTGTSWSAPVTIASAPGETAILKPHNAGMVLDFNAYNTAYDLQYLIFDRLVFDADDGTLGVISLLGNPSGYSVHHVRFQDSVIRNSSGCGGGYHIVGPIGEPGPTGQGNQVNVQMFDNVHHVEFLRSQISQSWCGYGFYISGHDNLLDGNAIYGNAGYGIQVQYTGASNNVIRNNRIYGNGFVRSYGGITVNNGSNTQVYNNAIYQNATTGVEVGFNTPVSSTLIDNNTIYGHSLGPAIWLESSAFSTKVRNNLVFGNAGTITDNGSFTTQLANLATNPSFVNATAGDFHLRAGSEAIGGGIDLSTLFTTDLEGATRTVPWDIGAYKYGGVIEPPNPPPEQVISCLFSEGIGTSTACHGFANGAQTTYTGTLSGDATWATGLTAASTTSLQVSGNGRVSIPDSPDLRPIDRFGLVAWVNMTATDTNGCEVASYGDSYAMRIEPDGRLGGFFYNGSGWTGRVSSTNVLTGTTQLIGIGYKSGDGIRIWRNNAQVDFFAASGDISYTLGNSLEIGRHGAGQTTFDCRGRIFPVYVLTKELTQADMQNFYDQSIPTGGISLTHMAWTMPHTAQGTLVGAIDTDRQQTVSEPIGVLMGIENSTQSPIVEHFPLACCNVADCATDAKWIPVTNTANSVGVRIGTDSVLDMGDSTSGSVLPRGSMTVVQGRVVADTINTGSKTTLPTGGHTEWQYTPLLFSAPLSVGSQLRCRPLRENGSAFTSYTNVKTLTFVAPPLTLGIRGVQIQGLDIR